MSAWASSDSPASPATLWACCRAGQLVQEDGTLELGQPGPHLPAVYGWLPSSLDMQPCVEGASSPSGGAVQKKPEMLMEARSAPHRESG